MYSPGWRLWVDVTMEWLSCAHRFRPRKKKRSCAFLQAKFWGSAAFGLKFLSSSFVLFAATEVLP
jgi:hypothetical protein